MHPVEDALHRLALAEAALQEACTMNANAQRRFEHALSMLHGIDLPVGRRELVQLA